MVFFTRHYSGERCWDHTDVEEAACVCRDGERQNVQRFVPAFVGLLKAPLLFLQMH